MLNLELEELKLNFSKDRNGPDFSNLFYELKNSKINKIHFIDWKYINLDVIIPGLEVFRALNLDIGE